MCIPRGAVAVGEEGLVGVGRPAQKLDAHFVELKVLPQVNVRGSPEGVCKGLVQRALVQVGHIGEELEAHAAPLGIHERVSGPRDVVPDGCGRGVRSSTVSNTT